MNKIIRQTCLLFCFTLFATSLFSQTEEGKLQELIKKVQEQPALLEKAKEEISQTETPPQEGQEGMRAVPQATGVPEGTPVGLPSTI